MAQTSFNASQNNVLIFRKLPNCLEEEEVEDLLKHFGAEQIRYLGKDGTYKHSALARFATDETAQEVLRLTHQLEVLGTRLRVEFGTKEDQRAADKGIKLPDQPKYSLDMAEAHKKPDEFLPEEIPLPASDLAKMSREWNIPNLADIAVKYSYPPPTETVLMNIVHCLACTPKFYTQVLHLMNKMNLPPPFHDITMEPPVQPDPIESEESELESDDENLSNRTQKRGGKESVPESFAKRIRMQIQDDLKQLAHKQSVPVYREGSGIEDMFEVNKRLTSKSNLPTNINIQSDIKITPHSQTDAAIVSHSPSQVGDGENKSSAFGVFSHAERVLESLKREAKSPLLSDEPENQMDVQQTQLTSFQFLSDQELSKGQLSEYDIITHPVLSKTARGEPSNKLYVKNLHKNTTTQELQYIFGRYVDWNDSDESSQFNINHMTSGRMKGQAFVTFSGIDKATLCINEIHGFMLNDKPIAISFSKTTE